MIKREFKIDQPELKGLLVQNMDEKIYYSGNNFYDALVGQSGVFQDILDENRINKKITTTSRKTNFTRPTTSISMKTSKTRPVTSQSKFVMKSHPDMVVKSYSVTPGHKSIELEYENNNKTEEIQENNNIDSKEVTIFSIKIQMF